MFFVWEDKVVGQEGHKSTHMWECMCIGGEKMQTQKGNEPGESTLLITKLHSVPDGIFIFGGKKERKTEKENSNSLQSSQLYHVTFSVLKYLCVYVRRLQKYDTGH